MKVFLFILALSFCSLFTRAQTGPTLENKIRELEKLSVKGILEGDTNILRQVWAAEYMVNNPRNNISDGREAVFQSQKAGLIDYSSFERIIEKMEIQKKVVITMGYEEFVSKKDIPGAKAGVPVRRRFTNVWMKKQGKWRQVARHASIICT